jgi:membrane-bound ClpP family serine protease
MRVYNRRVYRNTVAFGMALLLAGVALIVVDVWVLGGASGLIRTLIGFAVAGLMLFGAAYVLTGFYGLAKAKD